MLAAPESASNRNKMPCLSKSLYLRGLQCPKLLWHSFHEPEAITNNADQTVFEQGREVGELAKRLFPDGIEVGQSFSNFQQAIDQSREALDLRRPLFEPAFAT